MNLFDGLFQVATCGRVLNRYLDLCRKFHDVPAARSENKNKDTIQWRFFIEIIEQHDRRLFDRDCYGNRTVDSSRIQ